MSSSFWTHPSALLLAKGEDPVQAIMREAREVVLHAIENGWAGPPFDPFELAKILNIRVIPHEGLSEARLLKRNGRPEVEFNPLKPRTRIRYSIAHEIAHTLFNDWSDKVRHRNDPGSKRSDEWQLEILCNLAAAEFLMPIGSLSRTSERRLGIDEVMTLRSSFEVSTEAMLLRALQLSDHGELVFAASSKDGRNYCFDYVLSRNGPLHQLYGRSLPPASVVKECTAIGYTNKGSEKWLSGVGQVHCECVGIAPYPGSTFPRVVGMAVPSDKTGNTQRLKEVQGNATEPRGHGTRILAHVVSDSARTWGAGFGKQMAQKFASAARRFRENIDRGHRLRLGDIFTSDEERGLVIVQLVAQHGFGDSQSPRIRYSALRDCLKKVALLAKEKGADVHMPPIGTGFAGGSWQLIRELINDELCANGINVTVYDLAANKHRAPQQGVLF